MKEKRRLSHAELMQEAGARIRRGVDGVTLKKTIEGLISRDFLERDEEERGVYLYVEWDIHVKFIRGGSAWTSSDSRPSSWSDDTYPAAGPGIARSRLMAPEAPRAVGLGLQSDWDLLVQIWPITKGMTSMNGCDSIWNLFSYSAEAGLSSNLASRCAAICFSNSEGFKASSKLEVHGSLCFSHEATCLRCAEDRRNSAPQLSQT